MGELKTRTDKICFTVKFNDSYIEVDCFNKNMLLTNVVNFGGYEESVVDHMA